MLPEVLEFTLSLGSLSRGLLVLLVLASHGSTGVSACLTQIHLTRSFGK